MTETPYCPVDDDLRPAYARLSALKARVMTGQLTAHDRQRIQRQAEGLHEHLRALDALLREMETETSHV